MTFALDDDGQPGLIFRDGEMVSFAETPEPEFALLAHAEHNGVSVDRLRWVPISKEERDSLWQQQGSDEAFEALSQRYSGVVWFNDLTEQERAYWLRKAASARPVDAWECYRREVAAGQQAKRGRPPSGSLS